MKVQKYRMYHDKSGSQSNDRDHLAPPPTLEEYENVVDEKQAIQIEKKVIKILQGPSPLDNSNDDHQSSAFMFSWRFILALDVGYSTKSNQSVAVGILYDISRKTIKAQKILSLQTSSFEYIPGLLAFREVPLLAKVAKILLTDAGYTRSSIEPIKDIILMCDGNGTLHPRLCGLACHLGLLFNLPAFGIGKTYLIGAPKEPFSVLQNDQDEKKEADKVDFHPLKANLPMQRGSRIPLYVQGQLAGYMLRTQDNVNPLFVSSGIGISQFDAAEMTLTLCTKFRQPEPIRMVDHLGRMEIRRLEQNR